MKYANRNFEYEQVKTLLVNKANPIFIDAYRASGVTSFIQEKMADVYEVDFNKQNILYIDANSGKPLSEMLFEKLVHSDHIKELQALADKKLGGHDSSLFQALLELTKYGPLLSRIFEHKSALPVYSGNYSSAMEGYLIPFFNTYEDSPFLIIIDAVEQVPGDSYDFLMSLLRCKTVRCILIRTEDIPRYDKLENYLSVRNIDITSHVLFERPQIKLIKELGLLYGVEISTSDAQKIITETGQNIHTIIRYIRNLKCLPVHDSFTEWEKTIILILNIWGSAINETYLMEIVSNAFAEDSASAFQIALASLKERCVVSNNSIGWELSTHYPKEEKTMEIVRKKIANGERVIIYTSWTRTDSQQKLLKLLNEDGIKAEVLTPKIPPEKREAWVEKRVQNGLQVLITNPRCVETGLDLNAFTTLIFYSLGYNLFTLRQASRRSWRINQTAPRIEVYLLYYADIVMRRTGIIYGPPALRWVHTIRMMDLSTFVLG